MWNCLKIELYRLLRSRSFYIALFLGLCFVGSHIVTVVLPYAEANVDVGCLPEIKGIVPFSSCMFFMGYDMYGWQGSIYFQVMPLLAAIPYTNSYFCDISEGYIKNLQNRCNKRDYLVSKYLVTFLSGGLIMVIPLILDILLCMAFLPTHQPILSQGIFSIVFRSLYYENTVAYIVLFLFVDFLFGGIYASLGLIGAYLVENKYLLVVFPYLIITILQMVLVMVQSILPFSVFDPVILSIPDYQKGNLVDYVITIMIWVAVPFALFYIRGMKKDEVV